MEGWYFFGVPGGSTIDMMVEILSAVTTASRRLENRHQSSFTEEIILSLFHYQNASLVQ
jgi:hypothetical protein